MVSPYVPIFIVNLLFHLLVLPYQYIEGKVKATQMSPRKVMTQYGELRGVLVTLPNGLPQVEAFQGLQYASILGGDLRFMPPTSPMQKWKGTKVALTFPPVCPQPVPDIEDLEKHLPLGRVDHFKRLLPYLDRQEEDCLNLNIYVPSRGEYPSYYLLNCFAEGCLWLPCGTQIWVIILEKSVDWRYNSGTIKPLSCLLSCVKSPLFVALSPQCLQNRFRHITAWFLKRQNTLHTYKWNMRFKL